MIHIEEWKFGKWPNTEYELTKADVIAFLETDISLSYADTMNGNLLSQAFVWKYERESAPYMSVSLPWPSQRGHEYYNVPEWGWPAQLLRETVALEEANGGRPLTREQLRDNLPSIGY